jgi:ionotropic glutamate receptor
MYAFFMEAAAIEYHVERVCDLKQLGGLLDSKGYGVALPKGESLTRIAIGSYLYFSSFLHIFPLKQYNGLISMKSMITQTILQ